MASTHHTGSAGQLALMAEFAYRGYNVSIPEIDLGDDAWVMNHQNGHAWRFQVKTSRPKAQKKSARFQFNIRASQINTPLQPDVVFAFVMRVQNSWEYLIMHRTVLQNYLAGAQLGQQQGLKFVMTLTYYHSGTNAGKVFGSKTLNLTHHLNDWSTWPEI
jgi:hypothetical protein